MKDQDGMIMATASVVLLVAALIMLFLVTFLMVVVRPVFAEIFAEIGGPLPFLTQLFLWVPTTGYVASLVVLVVALLFKEIYIRNKSISLTINLLVAIAGIVFLLLCVFALYLPLFSMPNMLSGVDG